MNIAKNGYIINNQNNAVIAKAEYEIYQNIFSIFTINDLIKIFNKPTVIPVFRLMRLDEDENVLEEISQDMISGELSCTYQSGKRRTLNVTLLNGHQKYTPHDKNYDIYMGCKFRFDTGILVDNTIYWKQQGVFLLQDPSQAANDSTQTVSFNLHDKFALFDGTVNGTTYLKTILPVNVPMKQAFTNILQSDKGNGRPFDNKPIIFNSAHENTKTYKTIKQDFGTNTSEILIDCAKTISSDVYYNVYGNMVVESNVNQFLTANLPIAFRFNDGDRILRDKSMTYNWSKLRNKIIVKGAIANGYQFSDSAENTNLTSPFNVNNTRIGVRAETINENKLYSDTLCKERAMYTLIERQRGVKSLVLNLGYLPMIDVNQSVLITLSDLNLTNANFIIDSFSLSISQDPTTTLNLTNMGEVVF